MVSIYITQGACGRLVWNCVVDGQLAVNKLSHYAYRRWVSPRQCGQLQDWTQDGAGPTGHCVDKGWPGREAISTICHPFVPQDSYTP